MILGGSACSPFQQGPPSERLTAFQVVPNVPYRAQQARDDCGPAALASLMSFRGKDIPVEEITRDVYTPELEGSLLADMENYARRQGFEARTGQGTTDLLRSRIEAGCPVIVLIDTGLWVATRPHYIVVYGFDEDSFLVHAGTEKGVLIRADDLLARWQKMSRLYLYLE